MYKTSDVLILASLRQMSLPATTCASYCQGELVFEGLVKFAENRALAPETTHNVGRGGAIYNAGTGSILFNGPISMRWNIAAVRMQCFYRRTLTLFSASTAVICCGCLSGVDGALLTAPLIRSLHSYYCAAAVHSVVVISVQLLHVCLRFWRREE